MSGRQASQYCCGMVWGREWEDMDWKEQEGETCKKRLGRTDEGLHTCMHVMLNRIIKGGCINESGPTQ